MMKKSLVALAVVAASGMAMAQSSVTLYGVADAGIGRVKNTDPLNPGSGLNKTRVTTGGELVNNGPSRVGFTGVEDLGNGNKVGFQFETGLSLADGQGGGGGGDSTQPFWARQANVFVGGNWGTIKAGRQFTVSHIVEGVYDLTGLANYSVVSNTFGEAGIGHRANAAIAYVSPNMSGFQAAIAHVNRNNINNGVNKDIWDIGAWYTNAGLAVGLSANKVQGAKTQYQLGGKYDFGNFALAAGFQKTNVLRGFSLGGQAKFGAFTVTLDLARVTRRADGGPKVTNGVLEGKYALSKRTFLYADFVRLDKANNWGLGIHHSF